MSRRVRTDARRCLLPTGTPALDITAPCAYRTLRGNGSGWRD
ncbi:hypothetical protein [Micromonospora sp. CA-246542]